MGSNRFADLTSDDPIGEFAKTLPGRNEPVLMRAVDAAYFTAVSDVFARMVKDLDHGQLTVARVDMVRRMDKVRTVYAEMRQRAEDIEG